MCGQSVDGALRTYYVAVEEIWWDYAPGVAQVLSQTSPYLIANSSHPGSVYLKAHYVLYSDANFTTPVPIPPAWQHLALIGPVLKVVVGDQLNVTLLNRARFPCSISTSALYRLGDPEVESVAPGQRTEFAWLVPGRSAPAPSLDATLFLYGSDVDPVRDTNTGLLGPLIVYRNEESLQESLQVEQQGGDSDSPSSSQPAGNADDDDDCSSLTLQREFVILWNIYDENLSHLLSVTLEERAPQAVPSQAWWRATNRMHTLNGRAFDTLTGLNVLNASSDAEVRFYVGAFGGTDRLSSIHAPSWFAATVRALEQAGGGIQVQTATLRLSTLTTLVASMVPFQLGRWPIRCEVNSHLQAGMYASLTVNASSHNSTQSADSFLTPAGATSPGRLRRFYVAVEEVLWDYAPRPPEPMTDVARFYLESGPDAVGRVYRKARYVEYTDASFSVRSPRPPRWMHLGILGPVFELRVGDLLEVVLLNRVSFPVNLHPRGLSLLSARAQDGSVPLVSPGQQTSTQWLVSEQVSPAPQQQSSIGWLYGSDDLPNQIGATANAGLVGVFLVSRNLNDEASGSEGANEDDDDEIPAQEPDHLFVLYYSIFDENESPFASHIVPGPSSDPARNRMHAINGLMYDNVPGLTVSLNSSVRWYVTSLGDQEDAHAVTWRGSLLRWLAGDQHYQSTVITHPGAALTVDMDVRRPGIFPLMCGVSDHEAAGMIASYSVDESINSTRYSVSIDGNMEGNNLEYYVAAQDMLWEYAPGVVPEYVFQKARYVGYVDQNFSSPLSSNETLGILGPTIRAVVGDRLWIHFWNNASFPFNLRSDGVVEAVLAEDGTILEPDFLVEPGGHVIYVWTITDSSGPGPRYSSRAWSYLSDGLPGKPDSGSAAGLVGTLIVTLPGLETSDDDLSPVDVDVEYPLLWSVFNEQQSPYWVRNAPLHPELIPGVGGSSAGLFPSLNGRMFATLNGLVATRDDVVRWYCMCVGGVESRHVAFWQGFALSQLQGKLQATSLQLLPTFSLAADLLADCAGNWTISDAIAENFDGGLYASFEVLPAQAGTLQISWITILFTMGMSLLMVASSGGGLA